MSAQGLDLESATIDDAVNLTSWFSRPIANKKSDQDHARMAISFINDYTTSGSSPDLMKIKFRPESDVFWPISSESQDAMLQELHKSSEVNVTLLMKIHLEFVRGRSDDSKEPIVHSADWFVDVVPNSDLSNQLQNAIKNPGSKVKLLLSK
jgi:hypothetical protein